MATQVEFTVLLASYLYTGFVFLHIFKIAIVINLIAWTCLLCYCAFYPRLPALLLSSLEEILA